MADEIRFTGSLTLSNGSLRDTRSTTKQITQATARMDFHTQTIGNTHEQITIVSDITTPGVCMFTHLGTANYVELGVVVSGTFYPFVRINAGESWPLRLGTTAPYAKASTGSIELACCIYAA